MGSHFALFRERRPGPAVAGPESTQRGLDSRAGRSRGGLRKVEVLRKPLARLLVLPGSPWLPPSASMPQVGLMTNKFLSCGNYM